jgi:3-hydroxyisobutyrate dehydrogenase-like beta-hydroxyacid dehydrogenase
MPVIVLLHPGAMGSAVGAALGGRGHEVRWVADGRSAATAARADRARLVRRERLGDALDGADVVLSVCPPAAAEDVADQIAGFPGVFVDANAISPRKQQRIAARVGPGAVDGSIIGGPPWQAGTTRLYLSGPRAGEAAALFAGSPLEAVVLDGPVGQASALKMSFAGVSKISAALAAQARALAAAHGVGEELEQELQDLGPLAAAERVTGVAPRAWRWAPEMREIADACADAGLPPGIAQGAAELYERWDAHRDTGGVPLDQLIADLLRP